MAEVSISVGGRAYSIACDDGQEERVASLAARIDAEAAAFAGGGVISEARLLLMSALMIADKLDEAETKASSGSISAPAEAAPPADGALDLFSDGASVDTGAIEEIDAAIQRIQAMTLPQAGDVGTVELPSGEPGNDYDSDGGDEVSAQATSVDEADQVPPKPMTREEMRALRRQRRRAAAEQAQQENNG